MSQTRTREKYLILPSFSSSNTFSHTSSPYLSLIAELGLFGKPALDRAATMFSLSPSLLCWLDMLHGSFTSLLTLCSSPRPPSSCSSHTRVLSILWCSLHGRSLTPFWHSPIQDSVQSSPGKSSPISSLRVRHFFLYVLTVLSYFLNWGVLYTQ